jgi:hypothetical protein
MVLGKNDGEFHFCSNECMHYFKHPGYCADCQKETTNNTAGSTVTWNGIGLRFFGNLAECPTCFSVIKRKWFCFLFIPLIPLKRYRMKYKTKKVYFSREIKSAMLQQSVSRVRSQIGM